MLIQVFVVEEAKILKVHEHGIENFVCALRASTRQTEHERVKLRGSSMYEDDTDLEIISK